jgi:hypothetical protein
MAKPSTTATTDQLIGELYRSGLSMDAVATQTKTSRIIVTRVLRDLGIPTRSCAPLRPYDVFNQVFDDLSGEHEAYWLGFIYADGTVRRTCLNVGLAAKDLGHLEKLAAFLGCEGRAILDQRSTAWLQVSDRYLADRLRDLGIEPHRPRPTRALEAVPPAMRHHFLRGAFDGDGSVSIAPQLQLVGRLPFLQAVQDELMAHASTNPVGIKSKHDEWGKLYYKGIHRCLAITDYLYRNATIYLARKRERIDDWPAPKRRKQSRYWQ